MSARRTDESAAHASPAADYRRARRRRVSFVIAAGVLVCASFVIDVLTGPAALSVRDVLASVCGADGASAAHRTIVWTFRIPVALFALLVGAALGSAGAELQTILDNPLASPYTLGLSAAAGFGAALAIVLGGAAAPNGGEFVVPAGAFAFALLSSLAVYGIAHLKRGAADAILLGGVALLFLFNSAVAFLQYAASEEQLQSIVFWMFGSLQGATWPRLAVVAAALALTLPLLARRAWRLTALRLGDERARSLGVDVRRLRLETLVLTALLTATAVCFAGAIGFIGLVAPHLARVTVGEDQRFLLPQSALAGALLLSAASIASKLVIPGAVFPIGIATAFLGVPFFAAIVLSRRRSWL